MNCPKCGAELTPEQAVCVNCGQALVKNTKKKNKYKAAIFALCGGILGLHKFYLRKPILGIIYLIFGIFGIVLILPPIIIIMISSVEGILYLCMSDEAFDVKYN